MDIATLLQASTAVIAVDELYLHKVCDCNRRLFISFHIFLENTSNLIALYAEMDPPYIQKIP